MPRWSWRTCDVAPATRSISTARATGGRACRVRAYVCARVISHRSANKGHGAVMQKFYIGSSRAQSRRRAEQKGCGCDTLTVTAGNRSGKELVFLSRRIRRHAAPGRRSWGALTGSCHVVPRRKLTTCVGQTSSRPPRETYPPVGGTSAVCGLCVYVAAVGRTGVTGLPWRVWV